MPEQFEKTYLSFDEFCLILSVAGIKEWYGIKDKMRYDLKKREDINRIIVQLYEKEMIEVIDGKIKFISPYDALIASLKKLNRIIIINKNGSLNYKTYIYGSNAEVDKFLIFKQSENDLNNYCVNIVSKDDLYKYLHEEKLVPFLVNMLDSPDDSESIDKVSKRSLKKYLYSTMEIYDNPSGRLIETVKIFDYGVNCFMERKKDKGSSEWGYYDRTSLSAILSNS